MPHRRRVESPRHFADAVRRATGLHPKQIPDGDPSDRRGQVVAMSYWGVAVLVDPYGEAPNGATLYARAVILYRHAHRRLSPVKGARGLLKGAPDPVRPNPHPFDQWDHKWHAFGAGLADTASLVTLAETRYRNRRPRRPFRSKRRYWRSQPHWSISVSEGRWVPDARTAAGARRRIRQVLAEDPQAEIQMVLNKVTSLGPRFYSHGDYGRNLKTWVGWWTEV